MISKLPDFTLTSDSGEKVNSKSFIGSYTVVYFYPKNDTPGCTAEACSFRDSFESFSEIGAKVYGISNDSVESHKNFKEKHRLPFTLLSDSNGLVKKMFGVKGNLFGLIPGRETFVFDPNGILIHNFNSQFNATQHVNEALSRIKKAIK